jgi:hypothetical protein
VQHDHHGAAGSPLASSPNRRIASAPTWSPARSRSLASLVRGVGVAGVGGLQVERCSASLVFGLLPQTGQVGQGVEEARVAACWQSASAPA